MMNRHALQMTAITALAVIVMMASRGINAAEPIAAPAPNENPARLYSTVDETAEEGFDENRTSCEVRIFPAVLTETRRFGPVEEPAPEFFALRNGNEPGFNISPGIGPWGGWGFGWGGWGLGLGRWSGGWGFSYPGYGFGTVGFNRNFYRPWYTFPNQVAWSSRFPWYSPGGVGPNNYQPWYLSRNALPWYSPFGTGPNLYTPSFSWQMYYPWFSPNGPGPNIYTPWWQFGGCFYW